MQTLDNFIARYGACTRKGTALLQRRTPKAGFLFIPKCRIMITKIKTDDGKQCLAIVFNTSYDLNDLLKMQVAIFEATRVASESAIFDSLEDSLYYLMDLGANINLPDDNLYQCEKILFDKAK